MTPPSPFSAEQLYRVGRPRVFTGRDATEVAFPLGGLGTGTVSLGGRGNLRDFEIFGRPAKGSVLPFTFFALWAQPEGGPAIARILEGQVPPPYRSGFGEPQQELKGVARFAHAGFTAEYPVGMLTLADPAVPVTVQLAAWNPFIPHNVADSALPVAIFEWRLANPGSVPVAVSLAASIKNPLQATLEGKATAAGSTNERRAEDGLCGLFLSHPQADRSDPATGTLALATTWADTEVQTRWYRGGWWDMCHLFWDRFAATGRLQAVDDTQPAGQNPDVCSLALHATIGPGESVTLPVMLAWHFPLLANPWRADPADEYPVLDTWAGAHFADAWAVARHTAAQRDRLWHDTETWRRAIFDSTLPAVVLEAATSQASIMRSPTCFLLADGSFFGWEGCHDNGGCCHGNCTHVWNYEQAVAFLFPQLERSMRRTEFLHNTRPSGHMGFRTFLPPGVKISDFKPAADGQMGAIIQVYRDWQLSGDDAFLREVWPGVARALEYAWTMTPDRLSPAGQGGRSMDSPWDPDADGVMEGEQHNTYDIEFFGPNPLCTIMYLGALQAAARMADHLGEPAKAEQYRRLAQSGRAKVERELWNGEYFVQQVRVIEGVQVPDFLRSPDLCGPDCPCKQSPGGKAPALAGGDAAPKYQHGDGCLADQLLGQWAAHVAGLGHLLDPALVARAVKAVFDHNFCSPVGAFSNVQRVYALNEESGLLLCTWPRGNRPALPFPYSDEVWTGIEYQVAAHLIYEGFLDEGLTIVAAVAERYAGHNRNPWNQVECGHHYARAMASWSVKLALDGFSFNATEQRLGFAPKVNAEDFRTFWSTGTAWGTYEQRVGEGLFRLTVLGGEQVVRQLDLAGLPAGPVTVLLPGGPVSAASLGSSLALADAVDLLAGQSLTIQA